LFDPPCPLTIDIVGHKSVYKLITGGETRCHKIFDQRPTDKAAHLVARRGSATTASGVVAGFQANIGRGLEAGVSGKDLDRTTGSIASKKCSLWALQDFNALNIRQIHIQKVLSRVIDAVNINGIGV